MTTNRTTLAALRAGFAASMLFAPRLSARMWLGGKPSDRRARLVQLIGVRDVVLASGLWLSAKPRPWLMAAAVADAADSIGSLAATARTGRLRTLATAVLAAGSAAVGVRASDDAKHNAAS
jgi:hypothetical protein